ncbi:single-strand selective monofunctional uracil DNA glycosylase-like [Centruroides vittatus]|uniref:single-strand selective monofunctional uracil DNA glycosylase-like n=1 Tax=Centruroides vittatus TaxID=120091 RepID=UPI0035104008
MMSEIIRRDEYSLLSKRIKIEGKSFPDELHEIESEQCRQLLSLQFCESVQYIYNPLDYAQQTHRMYLSKYCCGPKRILLLGMNPGPFGMAQNGVPFGEISCVKNWLKISGTVGKPAHEHPQRIIQGFDCKRSEVSGKRFWEFFKDISGTPDTFFKYSFVHNYCPLSFLSKTGKNITPPQLNVSTRNDLNAICDEALRKVVNLLNVKILIAVGKYAEERAKIALRRISEITICNIMHPSPINPAANKGWNEIVKKQLQDLDVLHYFLP